MNDDLPVACWFRAWLVVEVGFGLAALGGLVLSPAETATTFAWDIQPPAVAALIGAFYLALTPVLVLAVTRRRWTSVRVLVLPAAAFTTTELLTTILHWDRFSTGSFAFAVWLASYLLPPPILVAGYRWHQRRIQPGSGAGDGPRLAPRRQAVLRVAGTFMVAEALVGFAWLPLLTEASLVDFTPLTARVVCGWLLLAGALLVAAAREADAEHAAIVVPFLLLLPVTVVAQLARFPDQVDLTSAGAGVNVVRLTVLAWCGIALVRTRPTLSAATAP